jgi:hypothetical protein
VPNQATGGNSKPRIIVLSRLFVFFLDAQSETNADLGGPGLSRQLATTTFHLHTMKRFFHILIAISFITLVVQAFPEPFATLAPMQTQPALPIINIYALDAEGAEVPAMPPNIASFRVTHDLPPTETVSFLFTLRGTAQEGEDYFVTPESNIMSSLFGRWFTFPSGENEAVIVITPMNDFLIEGDETVTFSLYTPPFNGFNEGGGSFSEWRDSFGFSYGSNWTATITITSDDTAAPPFALVTIEATDVNASKIPPGLGANDPAVFTLTRSGSNLSAITVNYSLLELPPSFPMVLPIPVMAKNGGDFETLSGSVTFAEGATTAQIVVNPIFDLLAGPSKYVRIVLQPSELPVSDAGGYALDQNTTAIAYILNYAPPNVPTVTISANDPQAIEDNVIRRTGSIIVRRHGNTDDEIIVRYGISGTALSGVDYVALPGFVTFPPGVSGVLILIDPIDDNIPEGPEGVGLSLLAPSPEVYPPPYMVGNPSSAGVVIRDHLRWSADLPLVSPDPSARLIERLADGIIVLGERLESPKSDFIVEASINLVDWEEIGSGNSIENFAEFVDVNAPDLPVRFYRMRSVASSSP